MNLVDWPTVIRSEVVNIPLQARLPLLKDLPL